MLARRSASRSAPLCALEMTSGSRYGVCCIKVIEFEFGMHCVLLPSVHHVSMHREVTKILIESPAGSDLYYTVQDHVYIYTA